MSIGLGVQGLADTFAIFGIGFESEEDQKLNKEIFETIYFASMTASKDLAKKNGVYETYEGSPVSKGIFQFDMWDTTEDDISCGCNQQQVVATLVCQNMELQEEVASLTEQLNKVYFKIDNVF